MTIQINKKNAITAFMNADAAGKKMLTDLLGKEHLSDNVMDMINSYEDACALEGLDPIKNLPHQSPSNDEEEYENNCRRWRTIVRAFNGKDENGKPWKPDYSNGKQPKWRIWLEWDASLSAFRFDYTYDEYTGAHTGAGSRHVFKNQALANCAGKKFIDLLNKITND